MRALLAPLTLLAALAAPVAAQSRAVGPVCVACRNAVGLRLNYRDRDLERVAGANITIWGPYRPPTGRVSGLALGLGATGASDISGFAVAPVYVAIDKTLSGIAVAGLGVGTGGDASGILLAGLGSGIGGDFRGIALAGLGSGIGGDATGIVAAGLGAGINGEMFGLAVAGLGFGGSGSLTGITIAGLGAGVAGDLRGLIVAGLGAGVGGNLRGITVAGLGAGAGNTISGIMIAGLGAGAGVAIRGLIVGGLGVGAPRIEGVAIAPMVEAENARSLVIAPLRFRAKKTDGEASVRGVYVSILNDVRGMQRGVSIGIVNYARALKGAQIGLVNIVTDGRGPRVLPLVNFR